jgi:hypothetical protein
MKIRKAIWGRVSLLMALALFALPGLTQIGVPVGSGRGPVVLLSDYARNSVILRWGAVKGADHYRVQWSNQATGAIVGSLDVLPPPAGQGTVAAQIQPLLPSVVYTLKVQVIEAQGALIGETVIRDVFPKGTYEKEMEALVAEGGAYYDPNRDMPDLAPSKEFWHVGISVDKARGQQWLPTLIDGAYYWGHNGFYNNHQVPGAHGHFTLGDTGGGKVSARFEKPIETAVLKKRPVTLFGEWDIGSLGRQTGYVTVTDVFGDVVGVTPQDDANGKSVSPTGVEFRIKFGSMGYPYNGPVLALEVFIKGVKIGEKIVSRGGAWANVRQRFGLKIQRGAEDAKTGSVTLLCDKDYDGTPEPVAEIACDVGSIEAPNLWVYPHVGSYNNNKINLQFGHSSDGKLIRENFIGGLNHTDKWAHNGSEQRYVLPACMCTGKALDCPCPRRMAKMALPDATDPRSVFAFMPDMGLLKQWTVPITLLTYANWKPGTDLPPVLQLRLYADVLNSTRRAGSPVFMKSIELRRHKVVSGKPLPEYEVVWSKELGQRAVFNTIQTDLRWTPWLQSREGDIALDVSTWPIGEYTLELVATTEAGSSGFSYHNQLYSSLAAPVIKVGKPVEVR